MFEIKWLWKYMGKKRKLFVIGLIIAAVTSSMLIINPMLSQRLIDEVITPQDPTWLIPILAAMLAVQVTRLGLRYLMIILIEKNSQQMYDDVRCRMFDVIQNEDYKFFGKMRTGDLMTRMTNDLDLVRHATSWIAYAAVDSVVIFVVTISFFFTINWKMTLCLAAVTPLIFIVTVVFSKIIRPMYINLRARLSGLNTVAQENIEGNRVVKAFAREEFEKDKFEEKNEEYRKANLKTTYVGVKFQPFIDFLSQALTVITVLVGGFFMINGELTAGEMLAFSSLTWALANPLRTLGMLINDTQRFFASCDMIIEVFYSEPTIVDRNNAKKPEKRPEGEVEFKNVSFSIGKAQIVQDIDFHIRPGKTLGIMGTTGSGKTSITNLLMRFYEPQSGQVLLDGININEYPLHDLRTSMGIAMQDVFLFSDSVDGNIAYGTPDMEHEEILKYALHADADGFIKKMNDGYDTLVGERGVGLSGGQKQRISLARALAMKPSVLILDDTTSAVDMETEQYIQKELRNLEFPCTKIIIAQRVSSVQDADEIIIMDGGKITERGTHDELIAKRGFYHRIWKLQNSIEEDEDRGDMNGTQPV